MVKATDKKTNNKVNTRYLPNRGRAREVVGIISTRTSKKKVNDKSMEIVNETWQKGEEEEEIKNKFKLKRN